MTDLLYHSRVSVENQTFSKCGDLAISSAVNGFLCTADGCVLDLQSLSVPVTSVAEVDPGPIDPWSLDGQTD